MGQSRSKKERREVRLRQEGQLANNSTDEKSIAGRFTTLLRKKAVTYTLAAGLALAGLEVVREHMPFWTGAEPEYDIHIIFMTHGSKEHAAHIFEEVDRSKAKGEPIKLLFTEDAGMMDSNYVNTVRSLDHISSTIRRTYSRMLANGLSSSNAEARCMKIYRMALPKASDFEAELDVGSAIRGLKMLPIESYPESASTQFDSFNKTTQELNARFNELTRTNATLKEFMLYYIDESKSHMQLDKLRNERVAKDLRQRFKEAVELFPELRWENLNGKELRAIGFMGSMHRSVYYNVDLSSDMRISMEDCYNTNSIVDRVFYEASKEGKPRAFTRKEAYLIAFGSMYSKFLDGLAAYKPRDFQDGVNHAMVLSVEQLDEIANQSEKISDVHARNLFVLTSILAGNPQTK